MTYGTESYLHTNNRLLSNLGYRVHSLRNRLKLKSGFNELHRTSEAFELSQTKRLTLLLRLHFQR